MKYRFLFYAGALLFGGFVFVSDVKAQELFIDENGKAFVRWQGNILGETTTNRTTESSPRDDDQNDTEDEMHEEAISGNGTSVKRIDLEDDRLRIKVRPMDEVESEDEATRPAQSVRTVRVRESSRNTDIVITSHDDEIEVRQGHVRTRTHFPITIGPENELIITTPAGQKVVTVLPDAAMKNLLQKGFPMAAPTPPESTPSASDEGSGSGDLDDVISESESTDVTLEEVDGTLVYMAKAKKGAKFLGLVPVEGAVTAEVSAETGQVLTYNEPWYFVYFGFLFI